MKASLLPGRRLPGTGRWRYRISRAILLLAAVAVGFGLVLPARAHVGGKDVFEQIDTGPYKLLVTVRMPNVIPGVATVEIRSSAAEVTAIRITPLPLTGEAAKHPPASDPMQRSAEDPGFFTGSVWLMTSGPWQVRMQVEGQAGPATAGVPVAAMPLSILPMQRSLGGILAVLGLILTLGMAGIVAAAVREARLMPGMTPTPARRRRAWIASLATLALLVFGVFAGDHWWKVEAAHYAANIYRPSDLHLALHGDTLDVTVGNDNVKQRRWKAYSTDEFLLDHGHIMHLYAIRFPEMDAAFHLHPEPVSETQLATVLPSMPAGEYKVFADVVYRNGFPETLTAELTVPPGLPPAPLSPEDASASPPALASTPLGPVYKLPDGYSMIWERPANIMAGTAYVFRFHLLDRSGHPAADMQPYLGMAGHAAFVKADGTAFAHTHPEGSAAMPSMMLANQSLTYPGGAGLVSGDDALGEMGGMAHDEDHGAAHTTAQAISPNVEFPYGFPSSGRYRIFVQMKHGGVVETGVFDADVQ
jgi:hypothetical protein